MSERVVVTDEMVERFGRRLAGETDVEQASWFAGAWPGWRPRIHAALLAALSTEDVTPPRRSKMSEKPFDQRLAAWLHDNMARDTDDTARRMIAEGVVADPAVASDDDLRDTMQEAVNHLRDIVGNLSAVIDTPAQADGGERV
jgi:hypothetical protein